MIPSSAGSASGCRTQRLSKTGSDTFIPFSYTLLEQNIIIRGSTSSFLYYKKELGVNDLTFMNDSQFALAQNTGIDHIYITQPSST